MILDRNWNAKKQTLTISYIDSAGHRQYFERRMSQFPTWDFDENGKYSNWDGRKISHILKSTDTYKPSEFDILEYMYCSDYKSEFEAIRYPKMYSTDIETEISHTFPDPALAEQRITTISIAAPDYSVIVLAIRPFSDQQLESFKKSYVDYINNNDFAKKHCDISKVRVLYQYFSKEEDMLRHFFEKMVPKMEVICGWNYLKFDWQYMTNRLKILFGDKEARTILYHSSPTGEVQSIKVIDNRQNEVRLTVPRHVAILDYMELVEKYDYTIKYKESLKLDWIATAAVNAQKIKYQGDLQQLYEQDYDKYVFYNAVDSLLIQLIDQRLRTLNVLYVYSAFTMLPLMKCLSTIACTTSLIWEDFYIAGLHSVYEKKDLLEAQPFGGGYVKAPRVGWHPWVACYDFASLYPSQIITCGFSFENQIRKEITGYDGTKCVIPWNEEELDNFRKDKDYFVTVQGNVYKVDKDYAFKRMQKRTKAKRGFYKYRGQKVESELLHEVERLIENNGMYNKKMTFSESVQNWLDEKQTDIYTMSLDALKDFKNEVIQRKDEDLLLDMAVKGLGNGAYGASSNPAFFWYNLDLSSDITAESRETTGYMEKRFDEFFHGEWWDRKDLHVKFGIKLDTSKREWFSEFSVTVYGDTDSLYFCYGDLFETFTPDTVPQTDMAKTEWILKFSQEFLNDWNCEQLKNRFNPRHGNSVHEFELETINKAGINLAKKKYSLANVWNKGNFYVDHPKVKSTGVELIKPSTPGLARKILSDLVDMLLLHFDAKNKNNFTLLFIKELRKFKSDWMAAPLEQISFSCNVGNYTENVYDDTHKLDVKTSAGAGTKGAARFNFMAKQRGQGELCFFSGKAKYYHIDKNPDSSNVFAFQAGELPEWAPACATNKQFQKAVIDPINRFCEAMGIQKMDSECSFSFNLFD